MPKDDNDGGGLKAEDQFNSFFRVYVLLRSVVGAATPEWPEFPEHQQEALLSGFNAGRALIKEAVGLRWQDLARAVYLGYSRPIFGDGAEPLWDARPALRLLWEGMGRHLANAMIYDGEDHGPLDGVEDNIRAWYAASIQAIGLQRAATEITGT